MKAEAAMASRQSKNTLLTILGEIDGLFVQIDAMERSISGKECLLDHLEQVAATQ